MALTSVLEKSSDSGRIVSKYLEKKLYLIVHPEVVDLYAMIGNQRAIRLSEKLSNIREDGQYLTIEGVAYKLHQAMPRQSSNLTIEVAGAYKELCVAQQVYRLRKQGYNAIFSDACLEWGGAEIYIPHDAKEFLPEALGDF